MMAGTMLQATAELPKGMTDYPTRHLDKSGQGPKRAVAEAVAHLLIIQPGIHNTVEPSSKRPFARV